jgi:hypothetical protein
MQWADKRRCRARPGQKSVIIQARSWRTPYLRFSFLPFAVAAFALPALGNPVTYTMTFTGGPFLNGVQHNLAPSSGSFTYDPTTGFSNFLVDYNGDVFNFTAAANSPTICSIPSSCSLGTAAEELQVLLNHDTWLDLENQPPYGASGIGVSTLDLDPGFANVSAHAAGFFSFGVGSPPAVGSYTIALVPEPGTLGMLLATTLSLLVRRSNSAS